jgi:hypothetical protein
MPYDPETLSALRRFIAEERPDLTGKEAVGYLVREQLITLGLLDLPPENRGRAAGMKDGNRVFGKAEMEAVFGPHPMKDWKPMIRSRRKRR